MLTDEAEIKITAGKGGDGLATFSKVKMVLGPTGGRGGNGGNVFFKATRDLSALNKFRNRKHFLAEDGQKGKGGMKDGREGRDLYLSVPAGSLVKNISTGEIFELNNEDEAHMVARGGIGGRGNFSFKSPRNTSPEEWEEGKPGQEFEFFIELRLIADAGLIGLPNAGKSSLLNELTKANAKVADYPFTTLEPNLGALGKIIIADIPGLIEGASEGKGLGVRFLKHIQRTKFLIHCLALSSEDLKKDYETIRQELSNYDSELAAKKEILLLTKTDLISEKNLQKKMKEAKKLNPRVETVSIHDWDQLKKIKRLILTEAAAA